MVFFWLRIPSLNTVRSVFFTHISVICVFDKQIKISFGNMSIQMYKTEFSYHKELLTKIE